MPRTKYTKKEERKAVHIEKSYEKTGVPKKKSVYTEKSYTKNGVPKKFESRAWVTVNKQDGGGKKKGGSGRKKDRSDPNV